jgi:predicted NAD-dependent protein-ADP-ribosyltransferase YbiA (DUF1768 family)
MADYILFYDHKPTVVNGKDLSEYYFLSNFYPHLASDREFRLVYNGRPYLTTEHLYQALKHEKYPEYAEVIRQAKTPYQAKCLGHQWDHALDGRLRDIILEYKSRGVAWDPTFDERKIQTMAKITLLKFTQNPSLWAKLDATGDRPIAEWSQDGFWGWTGKGGENQLGICLMTTRQIIRDLLNGNLSTISHSTE